MNRYPVRATVSTYCGVQASLKIHERVLRPQPRAELLSRHHRARFLDQRPQDLQRLGLQFDADALLAQFTGIDLELEHPEPDEQARVFHLDPGGLWGRGSHIDDTRRKCCQYTTVGLSH